MNRYEAMFILPESIPDEELKDVMESLCDEIKKLDGEIESQTRLGKRPFAKKLKKDAAGHYAIVTFKLPGEKVAALQARYKLNERIFRVQIVRQDKPISVNVSSAEKNEKGAADGEFE